jgi:DNA mismatch repair ATPase MutS
LYSGTNPEEASLSAIAFMKYLVKNKNVDSVLTTHFLQVCQTLDKEAKISNYFMDSKKEDSKIEYLYKLKKGISLVKGGIRVLSDMNYPEEILETIESIR